MSAIAIASPTSRSGEGTGEPPPATGGVFAPVPSPTYLLADRHQASSCFFRSGATGEGRKALVQITERCNLHCAHCFVSAVREGSDVDPVAFRDVIIPRLFDARVRRITLTGGEPFAHPGILDFCADAVAAKMSVGVCTNATTISDDQIAYLSALGEVHVNVSIDGFAAASHGKFRGAPDSFEVTLSTARKLAEAGLLQGILSTPNALTDPDEYRQLAEFAAEAGADYLLMNPLSGLGRGVKSQRRLAADKSRMQEVRNQAAAGAREKLELVPIRFPNDERPLAPCVAGDIVYVFTGGAVAVCPYLVFAARTPRSKYRDEEFLVGNILDHGVAEALDDYAFHDRFTVGENDQCRGCGLSASCGKGCPAAVVAAGGVIGDRDVEVCPVE